MSALRTIDRDAHLQIRSSDGRCANVIVPPSTTLGMVRDRIALELGVPQSSAHALALTINHVSVTPDITDVRDLASRFARGTSKLAIIADNCHLLGPKVSFELCQILKHWTSPALISKPAYNLATTTLRQIIDQVRDSPDSRHSLDAAMIHRVFRRVTRGLELIKKLGFVVTPSAVYAHAGVDARVLDVAADRLSMSVIPIESPTARRASALLRHSVYLPSRFTSIAPNSIGDSTDRYRRLRQFIDMSYEALIRLENVPVGLEADTVAMMPVQKVDAACLAGMANSGHDVCSICLERYVLDDSVMRLPCLHCYHESCATQWLASSKRCPEDMIEITTDCKSV